MRRVCIIGCGAIGSLFAAHLARVAEVHAFVRRPEHARRLNADGLHVSGTHVFSVVLHAATDSAQIPPCDLGILCTKATQSEAAFRPLAGHFPGGAVISAQNGLGGEETIAALSPGFVIGASTFMSGTRHDDNRVEYELDAPTWLGPFEPSGTPMAVVREAADLIVASGLKAEALTDVRPAQWSKLIFNAAVNGVAALTDLPHGAEFARRGAFGDLGNLVFDLMAEGARVAAGLGIRLHGDPWQMNLVGARTDHLPSMLNDVRQRQPTEVEALAGAIARAADRTGIPAPLHSMLYRLIRGREASWQTSPPTAAVNPRREVSA